MTSPLTEMGLPEEIYGWEEFSPDEVTFVSTDGEKPKADGSKKFNILNYQGGTGIYRGEKGFFPPFSPFPPFLPSSSSIIAAYPATPTKVILFNHEQTTEGNYAYLERSIVPQDASSSEYSALMIYVGMFAYVQIRENNSGDRFENFMKAHENCSEHDFWQATEEYMNLPLMIFLERQLDTMEATSNLEGLNSLELSRKAKRWIGQLSDQQIHEFFGLRKDSRGYLEKASGLAASSEGDRLGTEILNKLQRIGVSLADITIDHVTVPDSVQEASKKQIADEAEITKNRRRQNLEFEKAERDQNFEKRKAEMNQQIQAIKNETLQHEIASLRKMEEDYGYSRQEIIYMTKELPAISKVLENAQINLSSDKSIMSQIMGILYHQNEMNS